MPANLWLRHGGAGVAPVVELVGAEAAGPAGSETGQPACSDWRGASWIRRPAPAPDDDYTYFRRRFVLPERPLRQAALFIAAVHKYELWVNGRFTGEGPAYHYPHHQYYNAYDITGTLLPGQDNLLAVLTHWFGAGQGRPASAPGLLVKVVVTYADGSSAVIGTDASWKQRPASCWITGRPQRNDEGVGYVEMIDARHLLPEWPALAYDDSAWEAAAEIGPQPTPPWTGALHLDATRIVERVVKPAAVTALGSGRFVVDLGKVYAGRPQIRFEGAAPGALIAMQGGYTLASDGSIDPATNQHTDMRYYALGSGHPFTFRPQEYLGMRYFQVDNAPMPISADNFSFLVRHTALDERSSTFASSHPTLNQVWGLMKHSLTLGAQEQFLDTPTREKGGFLVDSMNQSMAAMAVFGERLLTRRTLGEFLHSMDHYWSAAQTRGRMNAVYPNGDGARDIPDFTQAFPVWAWAYYWHTGDKAFLEDNYLKLKSIADFVEQHRDGESGLIHRLTGGSGPYQYGIIDWPPSMRYGYDMEVVARTVVNAYAYVDYDIVARVAAELGRTADAERYRTLARCLKAAINQRLLNEEGVYVDGLHEDGIQSSHASQHANIFPLALGIVPAKQVGSVYRRVKTLKMSVGMVTVGWLIQAVGEMEDGEHLLALYTRPDWDGWASSLAKGATCTWESWDAAWGGNLSHSHPWGAIGLCGMQQYILGVRPLAPQFARVAIRPLPFGEHLAYVHGRVPSQRGEIDVAWERDKRRFLLTLHLPDTIRASVYLPRGSGTGTTVSVNGTPAAGLGQGRYLLLDEIAGGRYTFEYHYES